MLVPTKKKKIDLYSFIKIKKKNEMWQKLNLFNASIYGNQNIIDKRILYKIHFLRFDRKY